MEGWIARRSRLPVAGSSSPPIRSFFLFRLPSNPLLVPGFSRGVPGIEIRRPSEPLSRRLRTLDRTDCKQFARNKTLIMKKIILIIVAVLVVAGLVTAMVVKLQSGFTKVLTA